ncbi:REP element-mobilizing transposase RayT [Algoriphagus ratkowskyi]|uniref:IS200/IS605 family transposase n=1 Tax=Algoriphagus ratkowskyi TaxID=57028 RepID=A0A2W7S1B0_9BACT|nr:IS200/IS605 family transposase [Algoriphagus ratkowskyi]PZX61157.1 REP element-mobilizing transposase RayT [Algoriphagus ratkowskyi]TXD79281.1 IS200/IS605 family transposase [Algoriphagus ratkowskyi]
MPNTYTKMYCQAVFAVKHRKAVIQDAFKGDLYAVIGNLVNETEAKILIVNGHFDHVHCLFQFFPKQSVSDIMKNAKAKSSKWINESQLLENRFEWQSAFGAFTYSEKEIQKVFDYVKNQEMHHQKMTFREEYLMMLKAHAIDFSPEYLFKELE